MRLTFVLSLMLLALTCKCQDEIIYEDHVYLDHIRSVKFHHNRLITSQPIIDLNSDGQLLLTFDDILGGDREYIYRIIHCDKDWNPSDLTEMDYLLGFNDEEIRDFRYSAGTKIDYTNYQLAIPNNDTGWRISGNYLLVVIDEESEEIALTRRFMVADRNVSVQSEIRRSTQLGRLQLDQEIEIELDNRNFPIQNPQNEIFVTILQNGRWDNALTNIQPRVSLGDRITFDRTNRIRFQGFNEFRGADLRTFRSRGIGVYSIDIQAEEINVLLDLDAKRDNVIYRNLEDINGEFIIETLEYNNDDIRSEYVNTYFTLESRDPVYNGDVYVIGDFTDWKCLEEFRLTYDAKRRIYHGNGLLKQGYYDYQYAVRYDDDRIDYEEFEGSHYASLNRYHILVYRRSFKERYDELISVGSIESLLGF